MYESFCPVLSFTTKAAPMSSTDHGGGKRRRFIVADPTPGDQNLLSAPFAIHLRKFVAVFKTSYQGPQVGP